MIDEFCKLIEQRKEILKNTIILFITFVLWLFGYIFSRGRIPPDHPDGNNEDLVIPLWPKDK